MADPGELTCQEFVELVTEYLEGALPADKCKRIEAHLDDCDYCSDYLGQMRQTIRALGRFRETRIAPPARALLLAEFRDWKRDAGLDAAATMLK
jgi:predicted anti-sigma-YlaC factor YlaD